MTEATDPLFPFNLPGQSSRPLNADADDIIQAVSSLAFHDILETLSDMVCVSIDGIIRYINASGVKILGADSPDDLIGRNFQSLICDDLASTINDFLAVIVKEQDVTPVRIKGLNGKQASLNVQVRLLPQMGERAYIISGQNLTRQVELTEAVHQSEVRFRKLVHSALDLICVLEDGIITYVNSAGLKLLRAQTEDQVVNKPLSAFLHPDYKEILDGDLCELAAEDSLIPVCLRGIDQTHINAEMGLTILDKRNGKIRCMIELRDITAHNRAVTALRQSIETLEQRVEERTRELQEEVLERRRAEEMLRHVASHDGLTELPNRSLFMDRLDKAINHAHRNAQKCALLFIDLDGFKPINDTLGHDMGDLVLREVARRLNASIRETDTAARFGGDEFVLLLTDLTEMADAMPIARSVLERLRKPVNANGYQMHIGASIGIAVYPDHGQSAEAILKQADNAMYDVKQTGKNNCAFARQDAQLPGQPDT